MCGIAGRIDLEPAAAPNHAALRAMQSSLIPRGPDQAGAYEDDFAALLHRRLSVIDLEGGRQPMRLDQGEQSYVMVYNAKLQARGYRFDGHSDTEVLLKAYAAWGQTVWSCSTESLPLRSGRGTASGCFLPGTASA